MFFIDQIAEKTIASAINEGKLDDLAGKGKPLILDDDSDVPESLRLGYRVLKNAGYLPPEIEERQQALKFCDLLNAATNNVPRAEQQRTPEVAAIYDKLQALELRMRIKGIDTRFIHHYLHKLSL